MDARGDEKPGGDGGGLALVHVDSGTRVAVVRVLRSWWEKGIGVVGKRSIPARSGVVLPGTASIHMLFVRFPLDILFLDKSYRLRRACRGVSPWTPLVRAEGAWYTVELAAGTLDDDRLLAVGGQWRLDAISESPTGMPIR